MPGYRRGLLLAGAALIACAAFCAPAVSEADVIRVGSSQYAHLRGYVYLDLNFNGEMEVGECVVEGIRVSCTLVEQTTGGGTGEGTTDPVYTFTDEAGHYAFDALKPGKYTLAIEEPIQFRRTRVANEDIKLGTINDIPVGTVVSPYEYADIELGAGEWGIMYNFGNGGLRAAYMSKQYLLSGSKKMNTYDGKIEEIPEPTGIVLLAVGLLSLGQSVLGRRRLGR